MSLRLLTPKNPLAGMLTTLLAPVFLLTILIIISAQPLVAQSGPLNIFQNYFVTGDYVVGGWVEQSSANGFATGKISIPDCAQAQAIGQPCSTPPAPVVPAGADIVAAYLYWGTVEGSQTLFAGQQAVFNGYKIVGTVLGNPNAPTSWSSGGCTGSSTGSKTMRFYRADVRPYMPLDLNPASSTFGAILGNPSNIPVQLPDSGSNGNTQPNALGATLVVVYRVLARPTPALNAVVLYDGSYAPSNGNPLMMQDLVGFYQPDSNHTAKLTHIVANGQANKGQTVKFGTNPLLSLYGANPPFPGVYGAWDNATWDVSNFVTGGVSVFDPHETTSVSPTSTNSGCVNWGAIIFSTTVQDSDNDGLLDTWEQSQGYVDVVSNQRIALPGANSGMPDLFVELDYAALRDSSGTVLHSHLPKQAALDAVGDAFATQPHGIKVHFDLPAGIYAGDPYVISTGAGGNEIPETSLLCTNQATCAFPNQPAVSWKGGLEAVQNDSSLGNFQPGRAQSYHYVLFGHSLGEARSYWGTLGNVFASSDPTELQPTLPQLVSIVVCNKTAGCAPGTTVTIKSPSLIASGGQLVSPAFPPLILKPGDCVKKNPNSILPQACTNDANNGQITTQVTVTGSFTAPFVPGIPPQPAPPLNGTYAFNGVNSSNPDNNGVITTTFKINTPNAADGTYQFNCTQSTVPTVPACIAEPQLGVSYLGPTTSSGHADFGGGGDTAVTLGLWGADDPAGCQPDPSQPPTALGYCNNQVGTLNVQTGTLMHELGHTLTLTHGGTYYQQNSSVPTYEGNCKPNFVSVMNYLFQVRGFVDDNPYKFDYSGQTLAPLNETTTAVGNIPALSESLGVGTDAYGQTSTHLTRWYSTPNAADLFLHSQALSHCDGSALAQGEQPGVRVEGTLAPGGTFSGPLDWNNDLFVPTTSIPSEDLNHNGTSTDAPFSGFDDWANINLQQINARSTGFGFSEGGGLQRSPGGGLQRSPGGGVDPDGSGLQRSPGGGLQRSPGGGLQRSPGGGLGLEQDTETANSNVNAPSALSCTQSLTTTGGTVVPACTASSGSLQEKGKLVPLTWSAPGFGQIREYDVYRAIGAFTAQQIPANIGKFVMVGALTTGTPPSPAFIDTNVKPNTYTYFVTDANKFGARSGASAPLVITVK